MPFAAFVDSLGYEAEPKIHSLGQTTTVRVVPWQRSFIDRLQGTTMEEYSQKAVSAMYKEFQRWCQENGGQVLAAPEARFAAAAREYALQRGEEGGYRCSAEAVTCTTKEQSILAGYVILENIEVSFYETARAEAFVATLEPMAQARQQGHAVRGQAAVDARQAQAEASAARRSDPHPEHEAQRAEVVKGIEQLMDRELREFRFGAHFEYLGNCRIGISKGGPPIILSLSHLDHTLLTNVQWIDMTAVGIPVGVVYGFSIADTSIPKVEGVETSSLEVAQQVVSGLESLGRSCGAW
ncbi:hypothetical protein [Archangium gephyra]|nr:hypothetical protein [Archangium gephyra]